MNTRVSHVPWLIGRTSLPRVVQDTYMGYEISWNPDDDRWYVEADGETVKTFKGNAKGWHNMRYWIRTKAPKR